MDINDEYILKNFFGVSGKINGNHSTEDYIKKHYPSEVYDYLINRFNDSESLRETFIRIKLKIESRPVCPICGKPVKWVGHIKYRLFGDTCGDPNCWLQTRKSSLINKYGGYVNFGGTAESVEKAKQTKLERYGDPYYRNKEKSKQTKLERYGHPYYHSIEKTEQTCLERYGDPHYRNIEKAKQTCLERYGVDNYRKSAECLKKIIDTKRKNKTFTSSKIEEKCYKWLCDEYGESNIIRQYVDDRYKNPNNNHLYHCDFYIKSFDIFIEIQASWVHGFHPYDEKNPDDVLRMNELNIKSKYKNSYKIALDTWTITDILKRNESVKFNLKYVEIFDSNITQEEFLNKVKIYEIQ